MIDYFAKYIYNDLSAFKDAVLPVFNDSGEVIQFCKGIRVYLGDGYSQIDGRNLAVAVNSFVGGTLQQNDNLAFAIVIALLVEYPNSESLIIWCNQAIGHTVAEYRRVSAYSAETPDTKVLADYIDQYRQSRFAAVTDRSNRFSQDMTSIQNSGSLELLVQQVAPAVPVSSSVPQEAKSFKAPDYFARYIEGDEKDRNSFVKIIKPFLNTRQDVVRFCKEIDVYIKEIDVYIDEREDEDTTSVQSSTNGARVSATIDRDQLITFLEGLPDAELTRVISRVERFYDTPLQAVPERVSSLIQFAESSVGPGRSHLITIINNLFGPKNEPDSGVGNSLEPINVFLAVFESNDAFTFAIVLQFLALHPNSERLAIWCDDAAKYTVEQYRARVPYLLAASDAQVMADYITQYRQARIDSVSERSQRFSDTVKILKSNSYLGLLAEALLIN